MQVRFHFNGIQLSLNNRTALKAFIQKIFKTEKISMESIDIIFCTDDYLLEINRGFLKHDYYTDIITFNLAPLNYPVVGELYISVDRVRENAQALGHSFKGELHRVVFHGILHLCGYDDKSKKEEELIRKKENVFLTQYLSAY